MTLLGNEALRLALADPDLGGRLVVVPLLDPKQIGAASIDLRLGTDFLALRRTDQPGLEPRTGQPSFEPVYERIKVPLGQKLWIHPGDFLLGSTFEYVRLPRTMAGLLIGRSSWARLGIAVEVAGLVEPGYGGRLTYELVNMGTSPVALFPGLRIAQLAVYRLSGEPGHGSLPVQERYPSKYQFPVGPETSRVTWEEGELAKVCAVGERLHGGSGARSV